MVRQTEHTSSPLPQVDGSTGAQSTGELFSRFTEQVSELFRDELRLAELEMRDKAKSMGTGVGMFGAAGAVAYLGAGAAAVTLGVALALALPGWLAALIVTVLLFLVAAGLALFGRRKTKEGSPPLPRSAIAGVRQDVDVLRKGVHHDGKNAEVARDERGAGSPDA